MLTDTIRSQIKTAILSGNTAARDILKVALGEIERTDGGDEVAKKVIRKIIEGNKEAIKQATNAGRDIEKIVVEQIILDSLLPTLLTTDQIEKVLIEVFVLKDAIIGAKSEGQATGLAIKALKSESLDANGQDVLLVVKKIRG